MPRKKILFLLFLFLLFGADLPKGLADVLYLSNGRKVEGLVKREDSEAIELNVGIGTLKFRRGEVIKIEKSSPEEGVALQEKWETKKRSDRIKMEEARLKEYKEPKKVTVYSEGGHIVVKALLNRKAEAALLLDTGAALVVLYDSAAKRLGIDPNKAAQFVELRLADGRPAKAAYITLSSVKVENVEAEDVPAAVLTEAITRPGYEDGLLGMSFLNRFTFKVDYNSGKLILERR
jgi:clan AA aspartic protease (TIGR02281 family)